MRYSLAALAIAAGASAVEFIGDGVPLVYAATPYPNPPFDGVQYNATVLNGVPLNSSNEWPCLTADKYFSFAPSCSRQCLVETFKNATVCPDDDFTCHCTQAGSDDLNFYVIPCLTGGVGGCSEAEIGQFANFVHGGLCPYFKATTHEQAYGSCGAPSSGAGDDSSLSTSSSSSALKGYWPRPTESGSFGSPIRGGNWPGRGPNSANKADVPCATSIQPTWTKQIDGPTAFTRGSRTWTVTKATVLTVTDAPITWTSPISAKGTWAQVEETATAAAVETRSAAQQTSAIADGSVASATEGVTVASGFSVSTTGFAASPAQFTGAAARDMVGMAAFVAAGAAILI